MRKVVFLDRDGTINIDSGYVGHIDAWEFIPQVAEGLTLLQEAGFQLAVVTNQSGIAYGLYSEEDMHNLHRYMQEELRKNGVTIDAIAFCPHDRDSTCDCRKPKTGMAKQIEQKLGPIDYPGSWTVGDKIKDIEFGRAAGTKTALIRSKYWQPSDLVDQPDLIVESLYDAAKRIVANQGE